MKEKKLGFFHILTTYIWLPLVVIGYAHEIVNVFVYVFADIRHNFSIDVFVYFMIIFAVLMLAAFSFISLIQKNTMAVLLLRFTLLLYVDDYLFRSILAIEQDNVIWLSLPMSLIIPIAISIFLYRYYGKRLHLFNSQRMGTLIANSESIIGTYMSGCVSFLLIIIEGYSIYRMFQHSIGDGLFGVFVPVIAQLIYLFKTGFSTGYANTIYGFLITSASIYALAAIKEHTANQLLQSSTMPSDDEATTRLIPSELDEEFEELTISIYKWEYELRQAERNYNKFSLSTVNERLSRGDISDLDARKLIKYLNDNKAIIDSYPDKIQNAKNRCEEIERFVRKMWTNEQFPAKTIFIPKIYISDIEQ